MTGHICPNSPSKEQWDETKPGKLRGKLNKYYRILKDQILKYQHPISGLFPIKPGDPTCKVSHVRDSVYCATAAWALHQCYKKIDDNEGRSYELGQCAVKCMRAILSGWMQQCNELEEFKRIQSADRCLHSILDYETGEAMQSVTYHHLQMDAVGLYVVQLVQMITSGLQVIYTKAEVCFIQNLVFYLERSYRIPDYGMWERGSKQNNNVTELHSSSIGMAQAALEAISGFNLFGCEGDHSTVIFVDVDAHSRNRIIMSNLLPRESASKGADSALLPVLSWPAFATQPVSLIDTTLARITKRFQGKYGLKRFARDGHKTVIEERDIYNPGELKKFEDIENEWPMFLAYLVIENCFRHDQAKAKEYNVMLKNLLEKPFPEKYPWMPRYYYVPEFSINKERKEPRSQSRLSNFSIPDEPFFLWGQSIYIISQLFISGCLLPHDLDPLTRYIPIDERPHVHSSRYSTFMGRPLNLVIQVVLISESVRLQQMLATYGIQTQTPHQVEPIQIWPPDHLVGVGQYMGCSEKLGLSGRPARPIGQLGTSKFYRISGITVLCYPLLFEVQDFYLLHDMKVVIDECKHDFAFLSNWWRVRGRPTFCMLIKEDMIKGPNADALIAFLSSMKTGKVDGVRVMLGRAQNFVTSGCMEHLDYMQNRTAALQQFSRVTQLDVSRSFRSLTDISRVDRSEALNEECCTKEHLDKYSTQELIDIALHVESLYKQSQALHLLSQRHGLNHIICYEDRVTIQDRLVMLCRKAGIQQHWFVVRLCSALLNKFVNSLAPSLSAILVLGKQVTVGVARTPHEVTINKPLNPEELRTHLLRAVFPYEPVQTVLQQELILAVSGLLTKDKRLFQGIAVIRMGWLVEAMRLQLRHEGKDDTIYHFYSLCPIDIQTLLERTLVWGRNGGAIHENIYNGTADSLSELENAAMWMRQLDGCLARVPEKFYSGVYKILSRSPMGIMVCGQKLNQEPTLQDMTPTDLNFVDEVERLLKPIEDPAYRSIIVEVVMVMAIILERNQELQFNDTVDVGSVIDDAVAEFRKDSLEPEQRSDSIKEVYQRFYSTAPNVRLGTTSYIAKVAINRLLMSNINLDNVERASCTIS